jgi:pilus assembly protein CpaB
MNREMRTFMVLVVAVVVAAVASYGVYRAVSNIPVRQVEVATASAVVAAREMPVGELLTRESLKVVDWPAKTPLAGGFTRIEDVVDRGLVAGVDENEPLTERKLAPKGAGAGLPPSITPGMRALSIRVNETTNVAGYVLPGHRVDVLAIIAPDQRSEERISRVVVSNVEVLTANTLYDQDAARKDAKAVRSTVVTLLLSPIDAEKIALAQAEGQLTLTLRNPLDVEPTVTPGVRRAVLFASPTAPAPSTTPRNPVRRVVAPVVAPAPVPIPVARYTVQTIKAGKPDEKTLD